MCRPLSITRTDLDHALKAVVDAGLAISEILIEPRSVRVIIGTVANSEERKKAHEPKDWPSGN